MVPQFITKVSADVVEVVECPITVDEVEDEVDVAAVKITAVTTIITVVITKTKITTVTGIIIDLEVIPRKS